MQTACEQLTQQDKGAEQLALRHRDSAARSQYLEQHQQAAEALLSRSTAEVLYTALHLSIKPGFVTCRMPWWICGACLQLQNALPFLLSYFLSLFQMTGIAD
jgi:hypothetical protein